MAKPYRPHHQSKSNSNPKRALFGAAVAAVIILVSLVWRGQASQADHREAARKNARTLLEAAAGWKAAKPKLGCPTVTQLLVDHELDSDNVSADAWGGRYRIICAGSNIQLLSAGPDGEFHTPDDITIDSEARS